MKPDLGRQISAAARALTPDQLATLLAIKNEMLVLGADRTPILALHGKSEPYQPMIKQRVLAWTPVTGWSRRKWRLATLTNHGEKVLLRRLRQEVEHLLPKHEDDEE